MTNKVKLGKIGKPHGLKGYAYIHLNDFIKGYVFSNVPVEINSKELFIDEVKKHLKNRNLVKLKNIDTIEQIKLYRDKFIYTNKKTLLNINKSLPWPELFLNEQLPNIDDLKIILTNYLVSDLQTVLELKVENSVYLVPYVENNFVFDGSSLVMVSSLTIHNPVK